MHPDLFKDRINFILELAVHLHTSGTTVNRLESALARVARKLSLEVSIWSNPTGIMISFMDPSKGEPYTITRILRLNPGETNLGRLADADAIAEQVMAGTLDIQDGLHKLKAQDHETGLRHMLFRVLCYGLASAMVVSLFPRTGWADFYTSFGLGLLVGLLAQNASSHANFNDAHEAIGSFLVTLLVSVIACFVAPLSVQSVIVSALITLMPGLMLTQSVNELASQQMVSGSARLAGAVTILMKLVFGSIFAMSIVQLFDWPILSNANAPVLPLWMYWAMLLPGSFAMAMLFKANMRDIPMAMASVLLGFGVMKLCSLVPALINGTLPMAAFLAALVVTVVSNIYARIYNRPGALIRVPGIILLVPGSLGFHTLNVALAQDVNSSLDLAFSMLAALIALVAGILFGNLLVSSRRFL